MREVLESDVNSDRVNTVSKAKGAELGERWKGGIDGRMDEGKGRTVNEE